MTERVQSQAQAEEMKFLRIVHGVPLRNKSRSYEMRKVLNVEPLLRTERSQLCLFGLVTKISQKNIVKASCAGWKSGPELDQGLDGVTTSPTLLGPVLVWGQ